MNHKRPDLAGELRGSTALGLSLPVLVERAASSSRRKLKHPPVVSFVSLGCAKNLVDSEMMLGQLAESGAVISGDESAADTIVVNTCGFLESSRTEAMDIIRELADRKRRGKLKRIVVAGCLVQRDGAKIQEAIPEVDALVGVNNREDVVRAVWRMDRDSAIDRYLGDYHVGSSQGWRDQGRLRLTPTHFGYVRISEGCDQKCTFCTIPSIRGPMHCKTPQTLVEECRELIADGTREIILIGQDTTSYGRDIGYELGLAGLLRTLDADCDGAEWIRLMYVYPSILDDAIIDAIAECSRIVKYIDIPLQHINDRMLKAMHRRVTRKETETLLKKLRKRIPGVTIRTTFIVGFPGETESEFNELVEFATGFGFEAVGAFTYSLEAETPSGRMKHQIADEIKRERYDRLMVAQQEVAIKGARKQVGRPLRLLVDSTQRGGMTARHAGQAPDVDSVCWVETRRTLSPGDFLDATCTGSRDYDLVCKPVSKRSPRRKPAMTH